MIETLVVLTLIALVIGLFATGLRGPSDALRLERNARDLAAILRGAQAAAIAENTPVAVVIDARTGGFGRQGTSLRRFEGDVRLTMLVAKPEQRNDAAAAVRFFPDGSATGLDMTLTIGTRQMQVRVDWATGATQVIEAGS